MKYIFSVITLLFFSCLHAQNVNLAWAKSMGGASDDAGRSIAIDASGNVYTTGSFSGTADFNPSTGTYNLSAAGYSDIFVSKLDAAGNFVWAKSIGGIGSDGGNSIAADASGNVYITGYFAGTVDFDPGPSTYNLTSSGVDVFVSKLDASGNFVWAKNMGGASNAYGRSISIDASVNIYITGAFSGTADFDPGPGTYNLTSSGTNDIFVSKLDASGNFVWTKNMGGASSNSGGESIAVDASGNVFTTGYFSATVDFDPGPGTYNLTSGGVDIFVSKLDASGNFVWAKNMGGAFYDRGQSLAVDVSGNVYTTGYFQSTADFDPGPGTYNLTAAGIYDIFVTKLNASGNFVWAKNMGGTNGGGFGSSIAIDASGNVYTTGYFQGTADFDPGPGTYYLTTFSIDSDIFVSKLDASGNFVWAKKMGGADYDYGNSIGLDPSGNVFTTGSFSAPVDFDPGAGTYNLTSSGTNDIFVSKLNASGNFVWARKMGGASSNNGGKSIAVDVSGNVYTTGFFSGSVDFDPGPGTYYLTSAGISDIFITKLDASGNFVWAKKMGGVSDDGGASVAVDASGNVYTTGFFTGTADFDPGPGTYNLTAAGNNDIFISKLDASGNFVWAKNMGGTSSNNGGKSIAVDASGNAYTTGYFSGTTDFDPGPGTYNLTSSGINDIFISKLDASGSFVWAKNMGGSSYDQGQSIAVDATGNLFTTGFFSGTADFDPGPGTYNLTSAGNSDIFVSKLDASGNFVWAKNMGGATYDGGASIAVDASGNVYTTGYFSATADFDPGPGTYNLTFNGSYDIFVSKLDASGNFLWAKGMGRSSDDEGQSIAIDASGNVYTTGYFNGSVDFDPGPGTYYLTSFSIGSDIFVSKLDASGNFLWAKNMGMGNFGPLTYDGGNSIAVNASGNVYITGYFQGIADFDPGAGTYNLTSAGIYDIFVVTLSQGGVLPITLISFTAQKQQNDVMTNWETASQLNFSHYEIERSLDATHFEKAGTVQPVNGSGVLNYQFKDLNAVIIFRNNGRLFYRLKMIDKDGTSVYSKIVRVDFNKKYTVDVYPNPASDKIYIEGIKNYKYIRITDVIGKTVYEQKITQGSGIINISNLQNGVYIIRLTGSDDVQSLKFLKK